jgi:phage gp29-like protein
MFGLKISTNFPFLTRAAQHDMPARERPFPAAPDSDLAGRAVPGNALSDWYLALPELLEPKQVAMILRAALAGNLWQQTQLTQKMMDTWPTFRKALTELRSAVKMVRFKVVPYVGREGDAPTESAKAKAALVARAFKSFEPDRFRDEDGFRGMVFDLTDAIANGVSIVELLWDLGRKGPDGLPEDMIRASAWVHPRHYGVQSDGSIGVAQEFRGDPLIFHNQVNRQILTNPSKFVVAKYKSKSGSPLGAGEMRCLALSWVNIVYAMDWMRNMGQRWGAPFIAIPYTPGIPESERQRFEIAAKRCAAQGWMIYPRNSPDLKPDLFPAQSLTGDNPMRVMIDLAEKWCVQLLLGQTLTSDYGKQGSGSYALGAVHASVKQEKLEAIADWIAEILEEQVATRLVKENWGEQAGEVPTIEADFTHIESPLEAANRMAILTAQCRVPIRSYDVYRIIGLSQPQPGEEVITGGVIGKQSEALTEEERWKQALERQTIKMQRMAEIGAGGDNPQGDNNQRGMDKEAGIEDEPPEDDQDDESVGSHYRRFHKDALRDALAAATPDQLQTMQSLIAEAQASGKPNGEWETLQTLMNQIAAQNRINLYE